MEVHSELKQAVGLHVYGGRQDACLEFVHTYDIRLEVTHMINRFCCFDQLPISHSVSLRDTMH
jgi:hypothetical protein